MYDLEKEAFSVEDVTESESLQLKSKKSSKISPEDREINQNLFIGKGNLDNLDQDDSYLEDPDYIVKWDTARKNNLDSHLSMSDEDISPTVRANGNILDEDLRNETILPKDFKRQTANPSLDEEEMGEGDNISFCKKETMMPKDAKSTLINRNLKGSSMLRDKPLINPKELQKQLNFTNDSLDLELMEQIVPESKKSIPKINAPASPKGGSVAFYNTEESKVNESVILEEEEQIKTIRKKYNKVKPKKKDKKK
mmetsp:Transcript_26849/g.23707  ORF Transcript_26849/g.23707 Transcript_26849/m.23707 type:complete len:253 (+) Transcript_26849:191-949(+)